MDTVDTVCISPSIRNGQYVEIICRVYSEPALTGNIWQSHLPIVQAGTPDILLELLSNVIDCIVISLYLFNIANM